MNAISIDRPSHWRRLPRPVRLVLVAVPAVYVGVMLVLLYFENRLVYPLQTAAEYWEQPGSPEIVDVTFATVSGVHIHAWYLPQPGSDEVMLLCHGNGGNLSYRSASMLRFREQLGCSVLIFDYPGYGRSEGQPSERGCYEAADAAMNWLNQEKRIPAERVIVYGESLGGGVATDLASRGDCRALVLLKTFTSLPAVGQRQYPWLPVRWLMRNRFDSLSKIGKVNAPVFVSSGTHDTLIPLGMGKQLFEAGNKPKEFLPLENEGHNDRVSDAFMIALRRFLDKHRPAPAPD